MIPRLILYATILLMLSSCAPTITKEYSYKLNEPLSCPVGDVMMKWVKDAKTLLEFASLKSELLYQGNDQKTILIKYREYALSSTGYLARDAFNQDLKYDISLSDTITYKQARIKVISADQSAIKYIILSHPD